MRTRTLGILAGAILLGALVLGGIGFALAGAPFGRAPQTSRPAARYCPYGTPGPNAYCGMMGPNGHGMMGPSSYGPNTTSQGTPATGVTRVTIQNFAYSPASIQIAKGATVTWTNADTAPHTITFRNGMRDSGMLRQGQSFSYTFTTPGTYTYYCTVHPYMVATVTVTS